MAGVVDVLTGTGKVDELGSRQQLRSGLEFGLEPILDGLDVMIGDLFYGLDGQRVRFRKIGHQRAQIRACACAQWLEFGKTGVRQGDKPGHFDLHPPLHITLLRHERAQGVKTGGVTAVQR